MNRFVQLLVCMSLLATMASSLRVYPHQLAYFSELAGGPENGWRHLLGSNCDWGQDLFYLERWLDEHPEARPLKVAYSGPIDPAFAGIDLDALPPPRWIIQGGDQRYQFNDSHGPVWWYAVSVNVLRGEGDTYRDLLRITPVATAGVSLYVYQIASADQLDPYHPPSMADVGS
ncbi:hypothetical protein Mal4_39250 [Maioricimonas rarisocia]|uniref:Uncharacterized protein n=1 Tax=Maioricimonas rarisocia TaxID=2528026 RepID=A0A517ZAX1_9PLAN|nr:hypothetical protein [Maioricimonas rarisocia]QDU39580.1 hypothetical protein Mal4_39250 [Maioricimonas rarisocia]